MITQRGRCYNPHFTHLSFFKLIFHIKNTFKVFTEFVTTLLLVFSLMFFFLATRHVES